MAGLPTALRATYGSGSLHVAFCAEYDALPGGHACGHNIICAAGVGAALGAAAVADTVDLTVVLVGTPGEELFGLRDLPDGVDGPGKVLLLPAGVFRRHPRRAHVPPGPVDILTAASAAIGRFTATFRCWPPRCP